MHVVYPRPKESKRGSRPLVLLEEAYGGKKGLTDPLRLGFPPPDRHSRLSEAWDFGIVLWDFGNGRKYLRYDAGCGDMTQVGIWGTVRFWSHPFSYS